MRFAVSLVASVIVLASASSLLIHCAESSTTEGDNAAGPSADGGKGKSKKSDAGYVDDPSNDPDPDASQPDPDPDAGNPVGDSSVSPNDKLLVFVTSTKWNGNLQNHTGADEKCAAAATAGGHMGTFVAWVSDNDHQAKDAIGEDSVGWYRPDGAFVTKRPTGNLQNPISVMEDGEQIADGELVWTGTLIDDNDDPYFASHACYEWDHTNSGAKGHVGNPRKKDWRWTHNSDVSEAKLGCNNQAHLYCFQKR